MPCSGAEKINSKRNIMKKTRFRNYLNDKKKGKNDPINKSSEVKTSTDEHIDQDFEGFPHGQASADVINPKSTTEKKTAATQVKDGEKKIGQAKKKAGKDASTEDDGSGGAFDATEQVKE